MSEESSTTIKGGDSPPWLVAKGSVSEQKAYIIEAFGLDAKHYADKTLVEITTDADMVASALYRGARQAAKEGYKPPTSVTAPDPPEPVVQDPDENVGPFGLAALVTTAESGEALRQLFENNKDQWNDELTQLAKDRKKELGIG